MLGIYEESLRAGRAVRREFLAALFYFRREKKFIERTDVADPRETVSSLRGKQKRERLNQRLILFKEIGEIKTFFCN